MAGRAEDDQFVGDPGFDEQFRMAAVSFDQAEVELVPGKLLDDRLRVVYGQTDRAFRVALEEVGNDQRRQIVANGQRRAEAQMAVAAAPGECLLEGGRPLDQFDGLRQQRLTDFVQLQRLAEAVEELRVELTFELAERGTRGRL